MTKILCFTVFALKACLFYAYVVYRGSLYTVNCNARGARVCLSTSKGVNDLIVVEPFDCPCARNTVCIL